MPLYDYECEAGHRYEKRESFGAPAQQPCDQCGKPARRLLNAPPIVFKGSGWYVTDSKRTLRAGADSPASSTDLPSESGETTTEAAPASNGAGETTTAAKKPAKSSAKKKAAASSDD